MRAALPKVAVPELPADPAHYVRTLAEAGYFEAVAFTADDRARAGQYAANLERESLAAAASGDMDAFLGALGMTVESGPVTALNLARVTQLVNKTNQFNTTTIRRTEAEVAALAADPAGADAAVPPDRQVRRQRHRQRHAARAGAGTKRGRGSSSSTG